MIAYDVVYRYCDPKVMSGDGKSIRNRDNNELQYSIESLLFIDEKFDHIYIVYKGDPPIMDSSPFRGAIVLVQEQDLFDIFRDNLVRQQLLN